MRSKSKKITLGLCLIVLTACLLCGCSGNPKNFTVGTMTITLTDTFKESKMSCCLTYIIDITGYEIAGLKDYAKEICSLNGISTDKLVQRNNYYYFSNTQTVSGAKYTYLHCMLKEGNNYWICEFVCKHRSYDSLEKSMLQWADSITFDQQ